jgi:O-6-methylguanine DNA methyltransferase
MSARIRISKHRLPSPLGWLEVELGPGGLRRIDFAEAPAVGAALWAGEDFASSGLDAAWEGHFDEIRRRVEGGAPRRALPIDSAFRGDLRAGPGSFTALTWELIQAIPHGEFSSYGELAVRLGRPTASRAVARACASNPLLIVVPCHRVIRADGSPGGYRGGPGRKAALLRAELASPC